jgi:hypothetical protein
MDRASRSAPLKVEQVQWGIHAAEKGKEEMNETPLSDGEHDKPCHTCSTLSFLVLFFLGSVF